MIELGWIGAVTTTTATVKVRSDQATAQLTGAGTVNGVEGSDDIFTFSLTGLTADTTYNITVDDGADTWVASFKTFPSGAASFTFAAGSCCGQNGIGGVADSDAYARIEDRSPLFFLHMGDLHYANITTNSASLYWAKYRDVLTQPKMASMLQSVPMVYAWDDHDYGNDNSGSSSPSKAAAQSAYRDYVPHFALPDASLIYQTWVCGRVRFVMVDSRSARGGSTLLGSTQKTWLDGVLSSATEALVVIVSIVPWLGSWSESFGGYPAERQEIAEMLTAYGLTDKTLMLHGDAHMIGIDKGVNTQFDPLGSGWGPREACFAPLNATPSAGSDAYSQGRYLSSQQYGTVQIIDDGTALDVVLRGWQVSGATETNVATLRFTSGVSSDQNQEYVMKSWKNASASISDGAHTVSADPVAVVDGSEWPASDFVVAVWDKTDPKVLKAVIGVGTRTGNSLGTLEWNYDGHTDVNIADGDIVLLAATAEDFGSNWVKAVGDDSPVSWLRCDETSGTTAADSSGNSNHGTYVGGVTLNVAGALVGDDNAGCSFDGTNDYINWDTIAGDLATLDSYTFEGWFKSDDLSRSPEGFGRTLFAVNTAGGGNRWQMRINADVSSGALQQGAIGIVDAIGGTKKQGPDVFLPGQWHHVVAVYEDGLMVVYLDGTAVVGLYHASNLKIASTDLIPVGQEWDSGTPSDFFKGDVDELAAYSTALTPVRVWTHYVQGRRAGKL